VIYRGRGKAEPYSLPERKAVPAEDPGGSTEPTDPDDDGRGHSAGVYQHPRDSQKVPIGEAPLFAVV